MRFWLYDSGPLRAKLYHYPLPAQAAAWRKELTAFQAELEQQLALASPPEAKKDLQAIEDQIKDYQAAPAEKKKKAKEDLEKLLGQSSVLQAPAGAGAFAGIGFMGARPGHFLKPGKSNRMNMDDIYCLWSLERLCMVCDLKAVAGRDWYAWGADLLVGCQNDDGSWTGSLQSPVDTRLALLFLKRVNVAQDLTTQLRLIAPIKDLPPDKLKFISSGKSPSPGLTQPKSPGETQPSPGEAPPVKAPGDASPAAPPETPKP